MKSAANAKTSLPKSRHLKTDTQSPTMSAEPTNTLTSTISSLRTTLEDKTKSIHLLQNLIEEQRARHATEIAKHKQENQLTLKDLTEETSKSLEALASQVESLNETTTKAKARIRELKEDILVAEKDACERTTTIQQSVTESKQRAHAAHRQRQREKERVWVERKKAEIEKLTWKGMSSSITALLRNHDKECSALRYDLELSKEKLCIHVENDTLERIQSFQHCEEQSNSCVSQKKKDFAETLSQEHDAHNRRLLKLKTTLLQNEEALKTLQAQDTATMINEHETALTKVKSTMESKLQLSKQAMQTQKNQIEHRHRVSLEQIEREQLEAKDSWEKEYTRTSNKRVEERNEQNRKMLLHRREVEIKDIIRASLEKEGLDSSK